MNYNDPSFWLLFVAVYAAYWRLGHRRQNDLLLVASYLFYGAWDHRFLFLILVSTVIDFIGGLGVAGVAVPMRRRMFLFTLLVGSALLLWSDVHYGALWQAISHGNAEAARAALPHHLRDVGVALGTAAAALAYAAVLPRLYAAPEAVRRRTFLAISMVANLAILGYFKYRDFFVASFVDLLAGFGVHADTRTLGILLPPGISFYTFQAMSYTIDVYRREVEPTTRLRDFALFVCFFPHLVAGPIMRASTFLPQIVRARRRDPARLAEGAVLVLIGLFKKIVVADNLAPIVNGVFLAHERGGPTSPSGPETLLAVYAFAFQIYCDFSGYSAVARGISKWLGFELVVNFRTPYGATDPRDFWRRWHVSLSTWLRDYLYIPLGGSRYGRPREYLNLMITMALGGLWHGASWTYVVWGVYHGVLVCAAHAVGAGARTARRFRPLRVLAMFHLACLGWVFFRAQSLASAGAILTRIATDVTPTGAAATMLALLAFYVTPLLALEAFTAGEDRLDRLVRAPWPRQSLVYAYLGLMLAFFPAVTTVEFIYFQF